MPFRNLSPQEMFEQLARSHEPEAKFMATDAAGFASWKASTLPRVLATLGDMPPRIPLEPELLVEWEEGGLRRQKWLIDVSPFISATVYVNIPRQAHGSGKLPAIFCLHGHGPFAKPAIMGSGVASPEMRDFIALQNCNFGYKMAQRGYVTYSIDWIGFGERNDSAKPNHRNTNHGRDWCNLYYLHATMLGMTSLGINILHGMVATDFVSGLPAVDPDRIGVMGISGGGTMSLWMTLCDERIKATEIICYSDLWADFGFRDINYCGMQVAPGLYKLVDVPDLQGLLAPRPLLVDIAVEDDCFLIDTAMACFHQVEHIYETAGHRDRLDLDLHPGGHSWGDNKTTAFFQQYL